VSEYHSHGLNLINRQSTVNALTLATFSIGNIIGTEIFQPKDAPQYIPGKVAIMVLLSVQLVVSFILRAINLRLNKKKATFLDEEKIRQGWSDLDLQRQRERHAFMDLTDKQCVDPLRSRRPALLNNHRLTGTCSLRTRLESERVCDVRVL
jgi:ACS family allantoate permease-like MFS transporter